MTRSRIHKRYTSLDEVVSKSLMCFYFSILIYHAHKTMHTTQSCALFLLWTSSCLKEDMDEVCIKCTYTSQM